MRVSHRRVAARRAVPWEVVQEVQLKDGLASACMRAKAGGRRARARVDGWRAGGPAACVYVTLYFLNAVAGTVWPAHRGEGRVGGVHGRACMDGGRAGRRRTKAIVEDKK